MTTRLDRLFLLLDTGSTAVVRKSAAEQLGEVQKLHPHELNNLLSKVHGYLCSTTWETRIAAGQAVSAIAKNVPPWNPPGADNGDSCSPMQTVGCLPLSNFSMSKVLEYGVSLMASEGKEYEDDMEDVDVVGLDQKERLAMQKQLLNKRLGLDVAGGIGINTDDLYEESDLILNKTNTGLAGAAAAQSQESLQNIVSQQLLSVREKNRAKRKAKHMSRQVSRDNKNGGTSESNGGSSIGEPRVKMRRTNSVLVDNNDAEKLVIDNVPDNTLNMEEMDEWPFDAFCELLEGELFSPMWERRHGAATGLREVIRLHGHGANRSNDTPNQQLDSMNEMWLEDLALRLICVLALDRFGDFVSDEVIAPVRETCAQTLGVTVQHLSEAGVRQVVQVLLQLQQPPQWEVRHGGLLGLKYVLAVRQDLAGGMMSVQLPAIVGGLQDASDDVRGVAAAALLTVTNNLAMNFTQQAHGIVHCLWQTLVELDDLTASTNSIMALLAALLSHNNINIHIAGGQPLCVLVPRLWPFLRHNIASVRRAALSTMQTLISDSAADTSSWLPLILPDMLRLVYQRTLLEPSADILTTVTQVWKALMKKCTADELLLAASPFLGAWLCLMMQPSSLPFDLNLILDPRHPDRVRDLSPGRLRHLQQQAEEASARRWYIGGATSLSDAPTARDTAVWRARHTAAACIGELCQRLCTATPLPDADSPPDALAKLLIFHLNSKSAIQRIVVADVVSQWTQHQSVISCSPTLLRRLHECLTETIYFDEIALSFTRMQTECKHFMASLREQRLTLPEPYSANVLSLELCQKLCTEVYDSLRSQLKTRQQGTFDERRKQLETTVTYTATEQQTLNLRVQRSLAGCMIILHSLPHQMNPVVRPLMECVKKENNQQLQEHASLSLSRLVQMCVSRTPCPTPKIIKNLCTTLCSDSAFTPAVLLSPAAGASDQSDSAYCDTYSGILTLNAQQKTPEVSRGRRPATLKKLPSVSADIALQDIEQEADEERRHVLISRRGSSLALCQISRDLGASLLRTVPQLWSAMLSPLQLLKLTPESRNNMEAAQDLVHSLCILEVVGPSLHESLHQQLCAVLPQLVLCLEHPVTVVRHCAARVFGMMSRLVSVPSVHCLLERVLPLLGSSDNISRRQGAIEATATVIESLQLGVVPYLVLLVVPVLGRMSDQDTAVRLMASTCFGNLIRIMPLEAGIEDPADMPIALLQQKERQRKFLEQLTDPRCISAYQVPVHVAANLRAYQQDGVNWLAFLNSYQLHGVLCDDMGLGKTLQSICILAGDHHTRATKYQETKRADYAPLASLVVCPPTLTGHWQDEVAKFVSPECLNPLNYTGPPAERSRLQRKVKDHNLIIASYDVVRNDIQFFGKQTWNYCILDEGHIIKNHKTKLSKAVKQLSCNHRLILSGTPIQNNVLELWSLFDFLMPGFLGTERQFHARYGRPIILSRDPRSSQTDQEAGALAMEALHRQVLPFLLRRMKDDVLKDLPPKIIQDYYCDPSPLQVQLYEDFAKSRAKQSVETSVGTDSKQNDHIFQALQYLRKVCNHPALVLTPVHPEYEKVTAQLKQQNTQLRAIQHASKLTALRQLLMDCGIGVTDNGNSVVGQHRVLLFCQLKAMLDIVENDLFKSEMPDVTFLRIDGTVPAAHRHSIVNRFNNDPSIDVLLLTTHVGGLGLNLTGADTVVFVEHDWNPSKDLQAMDRAHRIGQKKVVNVYRLITRGTLEEKIMGLQKFKMNIANTVISQENSSLASMGTDQLLDLFSLGGSRQQAEDSRAKEQRPGGMRGVLENMGELWDEKQYETEYDLDTFMQSLRK